VPAETHRRSEPVDEEQVVALIWELLAAANDATPPDPNLPLDAVGLGDELAVLDLWDAVVEELAERSVADTDLDALVGARTLGELVRDIAKALERP
jgi:hypothetical protein